MENNNLDLDFDKISSQILGELDEAQKAGKNVPESVWAPGIPSNLKEEDKVKKDELLSMAVDYLMINVVIKYGFKIEPGFPRSDFPNIMMKKDGVKYAVIVAPSVYPQYITIDDKSRLNVVDMSKKAGVVTLFAPVGYRSVESDRAKAGLLLKGDLYLTTFPGFIELNDQPHQSLSVRDATFWRPKL